MSHRGVLLAPSLLAADQSDLATPVRLLQDHIDVFHIDVMDGAFVPNISMGPAVVRGVRPRTERPLDVHLMVAEPDRWVATYRDCGADWISAHVETSRHLERTVALIRDAGARAGVALNPATPFAGLEYVLRNGDFVLVMSVNPGFGGQRFLDGTPGKIAALRRFLDGHGLASVDIEVDGGVDVVTAPLCVDAGARILVAGSAITGSDDPAAAAEALRRAAMTAVS